MNFSAIKQIIRHLIRRKYYSGISILSLGIGLGCAVLMATYIIHEFSFDKYHTNSARLYRVIDGNKTATAYAMGEAFEKDIPEIESVCRIYPGVDLKVKQGTQFLEEKDAVFADKTFNEYFDVKIINGNPDNQLSDPSSLLISKRIAKKYFKDQNPVGETMEIALGGDIYHFNVSGVFENFPSYSSLQVNFIGKIDVAFKLLWDIEYDIGFSDTRPEIDYRNEWIRNEFTTFLLLKKGMDKENVEGKCTQVCLSHRKENPEKGITLQPISNMYLHSDNLELTSTFSTNQLSSLKIFMAIGLLILIIAIINFILISNADNNISVTEIACRKVNGATRKQIIFESLFKSVLVAFISLIPAFIVVWLTIPVFNNLFQKDLSISLFFKWQYILSLLSITLLTGISAGLYLGLFVSRVSPGKLFNNNYLPFRKRVILRGGLVIVQFVIFILLVSSFLIMHEQYNYSLHMDMGLNSENTLIINLQNDEVINQAEYIKNQVLANPNVKECIPNSFMVPPVESILVFSYKDEQGNSQGQPALVFGPGLIEMLGIKLLEGRTFNASDEGFGRKFIINKAAAEKYHVGAGEKIHGFDVIGIVNNFHFQSLHSPVQPVFIALQKSRFPSLLIKTNGNNSEVLNYVRKTIEKLSPEYILEYELLQDRIAHFYDKEEKQTGTIGFFSAIAMILSVMGMLGFVALNLVKRTKEIGIRKINGAKTTELVGMLWKEYSVWVSIAFIIAIPFAWYAMQKWLENFAYRISVDWWIFLLTGSLALITVLLTITYQTFRAAIKNPIKSLRYE